MLALCTADANRLRCSGRAAGATHIYLKEGYGEEREKFPKKFRTLEVLIGPVSWWGLATVASVAAEIITLQQRTVKSQINLKILLAALWYESTFDLYTQTGSPSWLIRGNIGPVTSHTNKG